MVYTDEWQIGEIDEDIINRIKAGPLRAENERPDWTADPEYKRAFLRLLEDRVAEVKHDPDVPERWQGEGRGIVISASCKSGWSSGKFLQQGYMPSAWACMSELRRMGCTLPITVAYLGFEEMDHGMCKRLKDEFDADTIDLRHINDTKDRMRVLAGWETKIFAIQHSPYNECLFMDSDNTAIRDPEYLFEYPKYRRTGAIFWPDLPPYTRKEWLPKEVWDSVGLQTQPDYVDFESGQLLVNKELTWKALEITRFINEHSDYWYKLVFGDKSTFFLGWNKLGFDYCMSPNGAGWNKKAILQHDLDGELLFQHCVQDKATLSGYAEQGYLVHEEHCFEAVAELRRKWDGNLWHMTFGSKIERGLMEKYAGTRLYTRHAPDMERHLHLYTNGQIGEGRAELESQWRVMTHHDGRTIMILYNAQDGPTAVMELRGNKFVGQWLGYEKNPCEVLV